MKKKKNHALLKFLIVVLVVFVGVFYLPSDKERPTAKQTEALTLYVEEINQLNAVRTQIILHYQEEVLGATKVTDGYRALEETILPAFTDYVNESAALQVADENVQTLHKRYLEAGKLQETSFNNYVQAYRTQKEDLFTQANEQLIQSDQAYQAFDEQLRQLAKTYEVTLPKQP